MNKEAKRANIYLLASAAELDMAARSLDAQEAACLTASQYLGYEVGVGHIYRDVCVGLERRCLGLDVRRRVAVAANSILSSRTRLTARGPVVLLEMRRAGVPVSSVETSGEVRKLRSILELFVSGLNVSDGNQDGNQGGLKMPQGQLRAKIYVRVSTMAQGEGTSLDTQESGCVKLAQEHGYTVFSEDVMREIASGADINRLQLSKLRRMVAASEVDALFVYTADRLARNPLDLLNLLQEFGDAGVVVRFVEGASGDSKEMRLIQFVTGFSADQERAKIRERTTRGKEALARAGIMPSGDGPGLYGYYYDPKLRRRVVIDAEAVVVVSAFQKFADGLSLYRIVGELNEKRIPAKRGGKWYPTTLRSMLQNSSYIGEDYWGKKRMVRVGSGKPKPVRVPKEDWIEIRDFTPPLVSKALFLKVQERLEDVQARVQGRNTGEYLLTSYAKCGWCGSAITGKTQSGGHRYYLCHASARRYRGDPRMCTAKHVRADWLEGLVWDLVVEAIRDPSKIIADLKLNVRTGEGDLGEEMGRLRREVSKCESEEFRLLELYRRGTVRLELLESQMAKLNALREDLLEQLGVLEEQQRLVEDVATADVRIREYCERLSESLDEMDFDGKRATMSAFGVKVVAVKGDAMVTAELDPGFVPNKDSSWSACAGGCRTGTWWWWPMAATPSASSCGIARVCQSRLSSSPNCARTRPGTSPRHRGGPARSGGPGVVGARLPSPTAVLDDPATQWIPYRATGSDGSTAMVELASGVALWYHGGPPRLPLRWVVIRYLEERRGPYALLCTDTEAEPLRILQWYLLRWQVEVTFEELRAHLGVETQRQWSERAIARTTPALFGLFSVVTLAADILIEQRGGMAPRTAAWYDKTSPSFADAIALVRRHLWVQQGTFMPSEREHESIKVPRLLYHRMLDTLAYAA